MSTGGELVGWVSIADADDYIADTLQAAQWNALASDESKRPYLVSAYRQILRSPAWELPETATEIMQHAQIEQALYLLGQGSSGSQRAALQSQGVQSFSIGSFSESFEPTVNRTSDRTGSQVSFSPVVLDLLSIYLASMTLGVIRRPYNAI